MKKYVFITLLFLSFFSFYGHSQEAYKKLIPTEKLHEDVAILKYNLETIHAGLYTYTSKLEMDAAFEEIIGEINSPMTQVDFYRLVLPLHNKIKNGHTFIIPPESWSHALETKLPHFPFDIYKYKEKLYVLRNLSKNTSIKEGDEILEINGELAIDVYEKIIDQSTKDGNNRTYPGVLVHQDFSEYYANIFGIPKIHQLTIKQDKEERKVEIKGVLIQEMRTISQNRYQYEKRPWYNDVFVEKVHLKIDSGIAILTIPSFGVDDFKDWKLNFKDYFKSVFNTIEKENIQELIIDIRDNGGGNGDIAGEVFSYLHDKPFQLVKDIYAITKRIPNKKYYHGSQFGTTLQMKFALKEVDEHKYRPRDWAARKNLLSLTARQPSSPRFEGKVYVLTSGWSFSASGIFTAMVKEYNRGIFIGEEAGGNPHTQIGDFEQMLILPNSGVRIIIPLLFEQWDVSFDNTGNGVIPKYWVRNTIDQEINKEDAVLLFTKELITNNRY